MKPLSVEAVALTRIDREVDGDEGQHSYAEGPPKKAKCDCCVFKGRIPHYIWTTHTLPTSSCEACGSRWRCCFRIGNFSVILEQQKYTGEAELICVVGPHWPFALVFTCGFIVFFTAASVAIFVDVVPIWGCYSIIACAFLALCLLISLGCKNPGIARRLTEKPQFTNKRWIYNDQANTWRSTTDSYSQEMNVVLHEVDHICPFTGTAIAQRNMRTFIAFQVALILLGIVLCIFVAAGVALTFKYAKEEEGKE